MQSRALVSDAALMGSYLNRILNMQLHVFNIIIKKKQWRYIATTPNSKKRDTQPTIFIYQWGRWDGEKLCHISFYNYLNKLSANACILTTPIPIAAFYNYLSKLSANAGILTTPTAIAAFNIGAWPCTELSSCLSNEEAVLKYPDIQNHFQTCATSGKKTKYIIIDEISVVSEQTLESVNKRFGENFQHSSDSVVFGGNISVLCFGDFFRLRPVNGRFIFQNLHAPGVVHL